MPLRTTPCQARFCSSSSADRMNDWTRRRYSQPLQALQPSHVTPTPLGSLEPGSLPALPVPSPAPLLPTSRVLAERRVGCLDSVREAVWTSADIVDVLKPRQPDVTDLPGQQELPELIDPERFSDFAHGLPSHRASSTGLGRLRSRIIPDSWLESKDHLRPLLQPRSSFALGDGVVRSIGPGEKALSVPGEADSRPPFGTDLAAGCCNGQGPWRSLSRAMTSASRTTPSGRTPRGPASRNPLAWPERPATACGGIPAAPVAARPRARPVQQQPPGHHRPACPGGGRTACTPCCCSGFVSGPAGRPHPARRRGRRIQE